MILAMGSPAAGLYETNALPLGSSIQPSGPVHAPELTSLRLSFSSRAFIGSFSLSAIRNRVTERRPTRRPSLAIYRSSRSSTPLVSETLVEVLDLVELLVADQPQPPLDLGDFVANVGAGFLAGHNLQLLLQDFEAISKRLLIRFLVLLRFVRHQCLSSVTGAGGRFTPCGCAGVSTSGGAPRCVSVSARIREVSRSGTQAP